MVKGLDVFSQNDAQFRATRDLDMVLINENDLQQMFTELDTVYDDLSDKSRKHKVSLYRNEINTVIMKHLEKIGYLSSTWKEEDTITNKITFATDCTPKISGNIRKK